MVHAAIHDALNSIDPRFQTYTEGPQADPAASPAAAIATAARDVLVNQFSTQQADFNSAYLASLALIPDGPAKANGIAAGQAAAARILALRNSDGSAAANIPYAQAPGLGIWEPTLPGLLPPILPGWGTVTPFVLKSGEQFRPDTPDYFDLASVEYANNYNEVKSVGDLNSVVRTPEQSEIARFWYEGSPVGWNRIVRIVSAQSSLSIWENARLFALVNLAMADGFIAGFNIRYHFNFWRPFTAIRAGDIDGNPQTAGDSGWNTYLVTPAIPDYPSTHSVLGAAAAEVLARFFGTDYISFSTTSGAPFAGITRSFTSFSQAARENADSRVFAGIHFRTACVDGVKIGEKIGKFAFKHSLRSLK
jgi:hypothetical protein